MYNLKLGLGLKVSTQSNLTTNQKELFETNLPIAEVPDPVTFGDVVKDGLLVLLEMGLGQEDEQVGPRQGRRGRALSGTPLTHALLFLQQSTTFNYIPPYNNGPRAQSLRANTSQISLEWKLSQAMPLGFKIFNEKIKLIYFVDSHLNVTSNLRL